MLEEMTKELLGRSITGAVFVMTCAAAVGMYMNRTPARKYILDDPKSGVYATVLGESLRMRPDPDEVLRGRRIAWAIRFEDRETAILPAGKAVRFRDGERVKVLEKREHVVDNGGGWVNWSRIQSLDRTDLPAAWIIDQMLIEE
jgi:hypothetical protein